MLSGVFGSIAQIPWLKKYYEIVHKMKDPGGFILSVEIIFNLSRIAVLPLLIILSLFLTGELFYKIVFLLTAAIFLLYSSINKQAALLPDTDCKYNSP